MPRVSQAAGLPACLPLVAYTSVTRGLSTDQMAALLDFFTSEGVEALREHRTYLLGIVGKAAEEPEQQWAWLPTAVIVKPHAITLHS